MTRYHRTSDAGGASTRTPFTAAEEAARDITDAEFTAAAPTKNWEAEMLVTDTDLPRYVEDIWDVHGSPNDRTQKLLDDKKALRAARP